MLRSPRFVWPLSAKRLPVEPNLRGHIPALDAIRGLAILVVTLFRFGGGSPGPARVGEQVIPLIDVGSRGVDLFFVLSGFLITGILIDAKNRPRYFFNFYARRTVRIFPLYYGVLLLTLVILPALGCGQAFAEAHANSWWLWFYGANLLQAARGEWCFGWLNHMWSLAVEEHFYLVWPAVIYFTNIRSAKWLCGGLFVGALSARVAWLLAGGNSVAPEVFTLFRLDGLAAGSWLALMARDGGIARLVPLARLGFCVTSLLLIPISILKLRLLTTVDTLWIVESCSLLVLMLTAAEGDWLHGLGQSRALQWLGKCSYGIYVLGNLLIPLLATLISAPLLEMRFGPLAAQLLYVALLFPLALGAALLSWHLYEKHWLTLKRYF